MATTPRLPQTIKAASSLLLRFSHWVLWLRRGLRRALGWLGWVGLLLSTPALAGAYSPEALPFRFKHAKLQRVTVPYKMQSDLIVIPVQLNGLGPFNFLLDTGAASSIITDPSVGKLFGMQTDKTYNLAGVGQQAPVLAYQTQPVRVEIGGIEAPSFSFVTVSENVLDLAGLMGTPVHGILGYDLFRSFVVTVQPRSGRITFSAPTLSQPPKGKGWTSVPIRIEDSKPYITADLMLTDSGSVPLKLVLDTGAGHALSLETCSDPRLSLPANRLRSELGRSLSGPIMGYLGRVPSLQLGGYRIKALLTSFPDSSNLRHRIQVPRNGTLGFDALRRFDIVIDYPHNQLLLRPNGLQRTPFEYDMSGVRLLASGPDYHQYTIVNVEANSAGAEAGLRANDELISIGLTPADGFTLAQITQLFHSRDGRSIPLVVRRADGELYATSLFLKRRI